MSFPLSPTNGQQSVVNNTLYSYNSTSNSWTRVAGSNAIYDLDDISNLVDGYTNTFPTNYNGSPVIFTSPWSIQVMLNGVYQPAFKYNGDLTWPSYVLSANRGYTLDPNNQLRFADAPPMGSQITIRVVAGGASTTTKFYPFKPVDLVLGS